MRNLAKRGGFMWAVLAMIPVATILPFIGDAFQIADSVILGIQLPALVLQLFSLIMMLRYPDEIF
jgi:hypothetical protein